MRGLGLGGVWRAEWHWPNPFRVVLCRLVISDVLELNGSQQIDYLIQSFCWLNVLKRSVFVNGSLKR